MSTQTRRFTRVAVVQLAYHPAAVVDRRSPLEDPLFDLRMGDSLLPESGVVSPAMEPRFRALRKRIREAYNVQLLGRVREILRACRAWDVEVIVFPEYAIPWQILGDMVEPSGSMVVVAGTHAVTREARASGIYRTLGIADAPPLGTSVCPVLHDGRLIALQPKLNPAVPEQESMTVGRSWTPVPMPSNVPGPLGVLICLDFLYREGETNRGLIGAEFDACRFLAVPSLTPSYTIPEFTSKAWEQARRYGRPVLYADIASGGGTSIFVDEGDVTELRGFPDRAGYLEVNDEGVIVADVDLGYVRPGRSTRYQGRNDVVRPYAAASLVYRAHPIGDAYAQFLEALDGKEGDDFLDQAPETFEAARDLLLNAGALPGASIRQRRLRRLLGEVEHVTQVEILRKFTREIVLPPSLLPLPSLRAALARGAGDVVFGWLRDRVGEGLAPVEARLRKAGEPAANPNPTDWTSEGIQAIGLIAQSLHEPKKEIVDVPTDREPPLVRTVVPEGVHPSTLGTHRFGQFLLHFGADSSEFDRRALDSLMELHREPSNRPGVQSLVVDYGQFSEIALLTRAEGASKVAAVAVRKVPEEIARVVILARVEERWVVMSKPDPRVHDDPEVLEAFRSLGFNSIAFEAITEEAMESRLDSLLARFGGAADRIARFRDERLREVHGHYIPSNVQATEGRPKQPALEALDDWLEGKEQTALVLGEFGSGKSTTLAVWADEMWREGRSPRPILSNLAGAGASADAEFLLLQAAGIEDCPEDRAALALLIRCGRLLPIFDGFDEMATRLTPGEQGGRLSSLLQVAHDGGRVIISSRDHYFPTDRDLRTKTGQALAEALGESAGVRRLTLDLFTDQQVQEMVHVLKGAGEPATSALQRMSRLYPLEELVHRPLLLGMVISTLDEFDPDARISKAEVYEKYLGRWLEQTKHQGEAEIFTPRQKEALAEALAEYLWRSGCPTCTPTQLELTVRSLLLPHLPGQFSPDAAMLEVFGGSFFVREGEDQFRFAHKSFLEFFLARSLVRMLPDRPAEALTTKPISMEVASFVGEILRRDGAPEQSPTYKAVRAWLSTGRQAAAPTPDAVGATAIAAANAVRLLLFLGRWAGKPEGWIPENADLRQIEIKDLRDASLVAANLSGSNLTRGDLSGTNLSGTLLRGAKLQGACLDRATLSGADATGANFSLVAADQARLENVNLTNAILQQSCWTDCRWNSSILAETNLTLCLAPTNDPATESGRSEILSPSALLARVAAGHSGSVLALAWSGDGAGLASAGDDGTVRIWDTDAGRERARLEGHQGRVLALAWSGDGAGLASAGDDGTVRIWDTDAGRERARLEGHQGRVLALAWSGDGAGLASAGDDGTVRIWDTDAGRERARLEGHQGRVLALAWSGDGAGLASAGDDGTVRIWDTDAGRERARLEGHQGRVLALAWSGDGAGLASAGDDGTVRIWDTDAGRERARLEGHQGRVLALAWSGDGAGLASAGDDGTVRIWDTDAGRERARLEGHQGRVLALAWSGDGAGLASAGDDGTVRIWDTDAGRERARLEGHQGRVLALAWSGDGAGLASAGDDGTVRIWDTDAGRERARLEGHQGSVLALAWSGDGAGLASAGDDGTVRIWDTDAGRERARLEGHQGSVLALAWSGDGAGLASAGDDGTVRIWDTDAGRERARLEGHQGRVLALAWSGDGAGLASAGDDGTVRIWDTDAGRERARLEGHQGRVLALAWSGDGAGLASAGDDGTVRIWDTDAGRERARLEGHQGRVLALAWSGDGAGLASAGDDGTVRIWDTDAGRERARLEGHQGRVLALAWSGDGAGLASAGDDGTVRIWDTREMRLLATFEAAGSTWLARTPGGFCHFADGDVPFHLAARRPERPGTEWYLPIGSLRDVIHQPDKVRAALAGELSGDDLDIEMVKRGWAGGKPWDGEIHVVSSESPSLLWSPSPPVIEAGTPTPRPILSEGSAFLPGRALTRSPSPPGREAIVVELLDLLKCRSPAILRGPRRAGKTSILHAVMLRLGNNGVLRHVSLEGSAIRTADDLARVLAPELGNEARPGEVLRRQLRDDPRSVLLIDEVVHLHKADPEVFAWLRSVGQGEAGILMAGAPWDWSRIVDRGNEAPGSSFGNDVTPVELGPIAEADAIRFLVEGSPDGVPIEAERTASWIVERCGGWPFYLQVMGFAVVQSVQAGNRSALVEKASVNELYESRLIEARDAVFRSRWRSELPPTARAVLARVKDGRPPFYRDLSRAERQAVRDVGYCSSSGLWLDDRPFYDWIDRNREELSGEIL